MQGLVLFTAFRITQVLMSGYCREQLFGSKQEFGQGPVFPINNSKHRVVKQVGCKDHVTTIYSHGPVSIADKTSYRKILYFD